MRNQFETWTVEEVPVAGGDARALLREYMAEMVSRYWNRPATEHDLELAFEEFPDEGVDRFLLARADREAAGCTGLKLGEPGVGYVVRMFVREAFRRRGGGAVLLSAAEALARELGVRTLRLDTRDDLVEARRLYVAHGFAEVEPGWGALYSDHFYEKAL